VLSPSQCKAGLLPEQPAGEREQKSVGAVREAERRDRDGERRESEDGLESSPSRSEEGDHDEEGCEHVEHRHNRPFLSTPSPFHHYKLRSSIGFGGRSRMGPRVESIRRFLGRGFEKGLIPHRQELEFVVG